jgi:hypothetical protein
VPQTNSRGAEKLDSSAIGASRTSRVAAPVVAEETGFSEQIPHRHGVDAFRDIDQATSAIEEIEIDAHYEQHRCAARKTHRSQL